MPPSFVLVAGEPGCPSGRSGVVVRVPRRRRCISAETPLARPYLRTITHCCPSDVTVSPVTVHRRQSCHPAAASSSCATALAVVSLGDFRPLFQRAAPVTVLYIYIYIFQFAATRVRFFRFFLRIFVLRAPMPNTKIHKMQWAISGPLHLIELIRLSSTRFV